MELAVAFLVEYDRDMSVGNWKLRKVSFEKNTIFFELWTKAKQLRSTKIRVRKEQIVGEAFDYFHLKEGGSILYKSTDT